MTRHLGLYKEAETCHLRALHILRRVLPESDLQIIWTINTLARSYRREGRLDEALTLHQKHSLAKESFSGRDTHTCYGQWEILLDV